MPSIFDMQRDDELRRYALEWHSFAITGNTGGLQTALDEGQDINDLALAADGEHFTGLSAAASAGAERAVEFLVGSGAQINLPDPSGLTPLMRVAKSAPMTTARLLMNLKADPNGRGENGRTALHEAARYDRADLCQLLVQRGADLSARDVEGRTPLHAAALSPRGLGVIALLRAGADPEATDLDGKKPAEVKGATAASRQALKNGAEPDHGGFGGGFGGFGGSMGRFGGGDGEERSGGLGHVHGLRGPKSQPGASRAAEPVFSEDPDDDGSNLFRVPTQSAEPEPSNRGAQTPPPAPAAPVSAGLAADAERAAERDCPALLAPPPQEAAAELIGREVALALVESDEDDLYEQIDELAERAREAGPAFNAQWRAVVAEVDGRMAVGFSLAVDGASDSDRAWHASALEKTIDGLERAAGDEFPAFFKEDWEGLSAAQLAFALWSEGFALARADEATAAFVAQWSEQGEGQPKAVDWSGLGAFAKPAQAIAGGPARRSPKP
jgi:hypothetical protein